MSEKKAVDRRYIGKLRTIQTKYGDSHKIYLDNLTPNKEDGTPDQFYKGALVWFDAKTNQKYHVKQISLWVPKEGMPQALLDKGYNHYITLNLEDKFEVTILE